MDSRQQISSAAITDASHEKPEAACDPVTVEVVRGSLKAVQGEMEALIERTAMSPFIREKKDFFAALFDGSGRLIAGKTLPLSTDIVSTIFERYPISGMRAGDIYWYNDCYASRGAVSHSPDQVFIIPVLADGAVFAFALAWAHFSDIGGMRPGSLSSDCTEIFQEGIIIPPVQLAREGVVNDDLLRLFYRNSRFPAIIQGDTRALMAAIRLGERRLEELVKRFGRDRLRSAFDQLIKRTARVTKERMRAMIPAGEFTFTDTVDSDGQGSPPIKLRYRLTVSPRGVSLDLTESDDQVSGPVNYLMHRTSPSAIVGSYLLGDHLEASMNAGVDTLIDETHLREGSILQPCWPAPLGLRGLTSMRNVSGCLGVLNVATGGKANASHSAYVIWYVRGRDRNGEPFLISDGVGVGYGARPTADGNDAIYLVAQENYPVEFVDAVYPFRMRRYAINPDTGGPGKWRGGCGVIREFEMLASEGVLSVRIDSVNFPPWGVSGGLSARPGGCVINPGLPTERTVGPLSDGNIVRAGDIIRVSTGGGGGWGHPYDRDAERVLADVLDGFVSTQSATRDYGVVLAANVRAVDRDATQRRRADRPEPSLFHRHRYQEALD